MGEYRNEIFCFFFGLLISAIVLNIRRKRRKDDFGRSHGFVVDQEKFSTQRTVTYCLLALFAGVSVNVAFNNDQSERSMIIQTIINFTALGIGFWLGSSKQSQDQTQTMGDIAKAAPLTAAAAGAVTPDPSKAHDGITPALEASKPAEPKV